MKRLIISLTAAICNLVVLNLASAQSLSDVAARFEQPQFLDDNAMALQFRLALLDHARPDAKVRVATFNFDYGKAVETLAAHMCAAVQRGVSVELLVDSK